MERITSHQVVDLMEAYNAVYAPQINEEQVQEDFENWVNSLVEEGYDLSEYTWDEMYDHYLSEAIGQKGSAGMVDFKDKNSGQVRSAYKSSSDGKLYKNYNDALAAKNSRMRGLAVQQGLNRTYRAGGGNAAVAQGRSPLDVMKQGSTNLQRQQRPATPAPGGASRPAAPASGGASAPTAGAKPTPSSAPAQKTIPSGTSVPAKPATSGAAPAPSGRPSIASDIEDIRQMRKASQQRIIAQGGTPATPLVQSFDPFDVVLGHLIDEGYADTEEAALQIMANMSEEWREEIIDEELTGERLSRAAEKDGRDARAKKDRTTLHRVIGHQNQDQTSFGKGNKATRRRGYDVPDTSDRPNQDEWRSSHNRNRGVKNKKSGNYN